MRDKILIVDDVDINCAILGNILNDEYTMLEAENGRDAISLVNKYKDELAAILLDLVMPEMDGFQVLEKLKTDGIIGNIPVLVISGEGTAEVEEKCFSLGVSDFISKAF